MNKAMEAARDAAWKTFADIHHQMEHECDQCESAPKYYDSGFDAGWNARGSQWVAVKSADDLPKEFDWYEVTVKETSSLGTFRYVDILSFGHSADCGNCWMNLPENGRVIAWRERSKPYTADSGQEGE